MQEKDVLYRYKYREVNEFSLSIITKGELKFSSPAELNDPFDLSPAYDLESVDRLFIEQPKLLKRIGDFHGLSPAKRYMEKTKYIARAKRSVESGEWVRVSMAPVGVFCFSRDPCNPLMWAHYAKNHTGFVVEFRLVPDASDEFYAICPHPVKYATDRPLLNYSQEQPDFEGHFLTKSVDWEYEQEERVINVQHGSHVRKFSRELYLHSIIAGVKIDGGDLRILKSAIEKAEAATGKKIPLYRAELSKTTFKVIVPDHPNPRYHEAQQSFGTHA